MNKSIAQEQNTMNDGCKSDKPTFILLSGKERRRQQRIESNCRRRRPCFVDVNDNESSATQTPRFEKQEKKEKKN
jgi:hypothetical protein